MAQVVSPGEWVRIAVPEGLFPIVMQIDGLTPEAAFIDRIGGNFAMIRAPQSLRRGKHRAQATVGGTTWTTTFEVTR